MMYQEFMKEQYELDRKAKIEVIERETNERMRLYHSQRIAEDMKVLQIDTRGMDLDDAAIINAQKFEMLKFLQHQLFSSLEDWEVSSVSKNTKFTSFRFTRREKDCFMPKGIKQSPLEKVLLKSAEKYIRFSLKDCTWLKFKFEGDNTPIVIQPPCYSASKDFQDSPVDEEDTRSSHEYLNDLEEEYQARALLAKSKRQIKDFEAKYHKVKAKLALLSSNASAPSSFLGKNKGLIAKTYDWDDEEVSSDENEVTEVKALMALTDEERVSVGKESARNGDWTKISMKKAHTLLQMEDNNDRKSFLNYLCIDLNYVEEQRNNLLSKYRNLVQELNTCKEHLLVLKQVKPDLLTMQHVNTEILKENQNLKFKLKELTSTTETWLNSSNIVNQCINEQIPTQKKKILGSDQLTEDTSNFESKEPVFVKSSVDNSDMPITNSNIHKSSETEHFTLPNQDIDEVPSNESQRNITNPSVVFSDSSATDYDSANESSVCSTLLLPLKKLDGDESVSGPKTIKSILNSSVSKTNSAPAGKLKNMKREDDPPLAIVMKELNELKLQISKKKSSYSRNKNAQQVPPNALQNRYKTQFKINCELCGQNNHLSENCYEVLFCKKYKRTNYRTCDHAEFMFSMDANQHHNGQGESSSRSKPSRPSVSFPSCIHCGYNDHHSNDCLYYPTCKICGSYDHNTHGHNRIISLRRGINPRNPQHVTKNCETCGSNVHTTSDHNDIEWFRKREILQAKNAESFKASKNESSSASRSKTPTKRIGSSVNTLIMPPNLLGHDLNGKAVNEFQYRGMIGPLMNLTTSRPNIQFSTALCKTSSKHNVSHLISVENFHVPKWYS
ncbi:hypothetical protein Tco_0867285 [Tanacetum coccineum]